MFVRFSSAQNLVCHLLKNLVVDSLLSTLTLCRRIFYLSLYCQTRSASNPSFGPTDPPFSPLPKTRLGNRVKSEKLPTPLCGKNIGKREKFCLRFFSKSPGRRKRFSLLCSALGRSTDGLPPAEKNGWNDAKMNSSSSFKSRVSYCSFFLSLSLPQPWSDRHFSAVPVCFDTLRLVSQSVIESPTNWITFVELNRSIFFLEKSKSKEVWVEFSGHVLSLSRFHLGKCISQRTWMQKTILPI